MNFRHEKSLMDLLKHYYLKNTVIFCFVENFVFKLNCPENQVLDKEAFEKQMLEKLIWICSVMLVGARHGGVPVGYVEKEFHLEVSELCYCHFSKLICLFCQSSFSCFERQYYYMHA